MSPSARWLLAVALTITGCGTCGEVETPLIKVPLTGGRYVVDQLQGIAASAEPGLRLAVLTVDRSSRTAHLAVPGGVNQRIGWTPLAEEEWPWGCRIEANATDTPDTWHAMEVARLRVETLRLGAVELRRPLLLALCPGGSGGAGGQVVLTEYNTGWIDEAFGGVLGPTEPTADGGPVAPPRSTGRTLWSCARNTCLVFKKAP